MWRQQQSYVFCSAGWVRSRDHIHMKPVKCHQFHQHLYHQLPPPFPHCPPLPPTSPHLYDHPQCAGTQPARETEQPGWLRRDDSGAMLTPTPNATTDMTTRPHGAEGAPKEMENPQGGWGRQGNGHEAWRTRYAHLFLFFPYFTDFYNHYSHAPSRT